MENVLKLLEEQMKMMHKLTDCRRVSRHVSSFIYILELVSTRIKTFSGVHFPVERIVSLVNYLENIDQVEMVHSILSILSVYSTTDIVFLTHVVSMPQLLQKIVSSSQLISIHPEFEYPTVLSNPTHTAILRWLQSSSLSSTLAFSTGFSVELISSILLAKLLTNMKKKDSCTVSFDHVSFLPTLLSLLIDRWKKGPEIILLQAARFLLSTCHDMVYQNLLLIFKESSTDKERIALFIVLLYSHTDFLKEEMKFWIIAQDPLIWLEMITILDTKGHQIVQENYYLKRNEKQVYDTIPLLLYGIIQPVMEKVQYYLSIEERTIQKEQSYLANEEAVG